MLACSMPSADMVLVPRLPETAEQDGLFFLAYGACAVVGASACVVHVQSVCSACACVTCALQAEGAGGKVAAWLGVLCLQLLWRDVLVRGQPMHLEASGCSFQSGLLAGAGPTIPAPDTLLVPVPPAATNLRAVELCERLRQQRQVALVLDLGEWGPPMGAMSCSRPDVFCLAGMPASAPAKAAQLAAAAMGRAQSVPPEGGLAGPLWKHPVACWPHMHRLLLPRCLCRQHARGCCQLHHRAERLGPAGLAVRGGRKHATGQAFTSLPPACPNVFQIITHTTCMAGTWHQQHQHRRVLTALAALSCCPAGMSW